MNMRRLEIFYHVITQGGFTPAARYMSLSQPTLSAALSQLEEELGTKLLNRKGRRVVPTEAGRILGGYAKQIFFLREEAREHLQRFVAGDEGELRLGGSTIPGTYLLPEKVSTFRKRFPQMKVSLQLSSSAKMVDALLNRDIELALVGEDPENKSLCAIPVCDDELVVVVRSDHPWAGKRNVSEHELCRHPLLIREKGSSSRRLLEERLSARGLTLSATGFVAEVGGNEALKQGVLAGLGVAVVSRLAVAGELKRQELVALTLGGLPLRRTFCLMQIRGEELTPAADRFKSLLLGGDPIDRTESTGKF